MSVFIPEPVFHGEPFYPSHPHRVNYRTLQSGADTALQVILVDRRTNEYLASAVSVIEEGGLAMARFTHLPDVGAQNIRGLTVSPDPEYNSDVSDWITAVV